MRLKKRKAVLMMRQYIYYAEVSVTKNHHFRAERQRHEARRLLGLAGHRPALAE